MTWMHLFLFLAPVAPMLILTAVIELPDLLSRRSSIRPEAAAQLFRVPPCRKREGGRP